MNDTQREGLKESAQQIPVEAVRQMEVVLKKFFEEENIPFDASHLKAALQMSFLIHPNLPPIYAQFIASSILILIRLIEEQESGLISSPIKM